VEQNILVDTEAQNIQRDIDYMDVMDPQDVYRFKQQHPQLFPHPPEEHSFDPEMKPHPPSTKMSKNPHHFHPSMARMPHPPDSANLMPGPHGDM
jgi:hypothetical protein